MLGAAPKLWAHTVADLVRQNGAKVVRRESTADDALEVVHDAVVGRVAAVGARERGVADKTAALNAK